MIFFVFVEKWASFKLLPFLTKNELFPLFLPNMNILDIFDPKWNFSTSWTSNEIFRLSRHFGPKIYFFNCFWIKMNLFDIFCQNKLLDFSSSLTNNSDFLSFSNKNEPFPLFWSWMRLYYFFIIFDQKWTFQLIDQYWTFSTFRHFEKNWAFQLFGSKWAFSTLLAIF